METLIKEVKYLLTQLEGTQLSQSETVLNINHAIYEIEHPEPTDPVNQC